MLMAKTKQSKPAKTTSSSKTTSNPPVSNPEPSTSVDNVVVDKVSDHPSHDALLHEFGVFMASLQQVSNHLNTLRTGFKQLEKKVNKELKQAQKLSKKKQAKANRKPSGFIKPTRISKELATFLGKDHGSEMARTEVTREINKYIREHKLQDKDNGRKINPDKQLKKLLKIQSKDELTYFNLQKYMSPHFAKSGVELTDAF
jgi:chromatin remodeling complex protein RSC6